MAPADFPGYWGEPTSTVDWCENNYEVSYYIAEMWNTVTNLVIMLLPCWGIREVIKQKYEREFIISHLLLFTVGFGSWMFHMTLRFGMQLLDELPMIWTACYLVYSLHELQKPISRKKAKNKNMIFWLLFSFGIGFTIFYLIWPIPIIHNASYGVLIIIAFKYEIQLIKKNNCVTCKRIFILSVSTCSFAFLLWNIDKFYCHNLRNIRESLHYGFRPLTQLHGWWHCIAGYSSYLQILFCLHSRYDIQKHPKYGKLVISPLYFNLRWKNSSK